MDVELKIAMNPALYLRNPEVSVLGAKIVKEGIGLIHEIGFEDFTFRKLALRIKTTEASIYRYFENKHRLLTYIISWYWAWLEFQIRYHTNNLASSKEKIMVIIRLLALEDSSSTPYADTEKQKLHGIATVESSKSYFTNHVTEDNAARLFQPYKELTHTIGLIFLDYNSTYRYPHSLASTLIEVAHHQYYFQRHLPRLTDFGGKGSGPMLGFLEQLIFGPLDTK